jgi:predicted ATP-dependent serine protease
MADPLTAGTDIAAGTYVCTTCGYVLSVPCEKHLGPCPDCHNRHWLTQHGGEAERDDN